MRKVSELFVLLLCLTGLLLLSEARSFAQASDTGDVNSEIEALRADMRADKIQIIKDAMQFTPEQSEKFWPIYNKYSADLKKLNDERVQLIKTYAEKFNSMTDADAKSIADKSFDLESKRTDLKKKYFKEFNKQLPATVVARFFQLEHRLDLLVNLKLASDLPMILSKPAPAAQGASAQ